MKNKTTVEITESITPEIKVVNILETAEKISDLGEEIRILLKEHAMYNKMITGVVNVPDVYIELKLDENYADCKHTKVELRDLMILGIQAKQVLILKRIDELQTSISDFSKGW